MKTQSPFAPCRLTAYHCGSPRLWQRGFLHAFVHQIDEDFIELETDEAKVHQIFTAILSNSVKFAGKKCRIKLSANKNGGKTELSAEDNGPGFAPEILPHIFERFYKGDSSHDRNISGSGLGLSIASVLANALGASIKAKNAPTGGALICLTFD